jgi:hypothetical protein
VNSRSSNMAISSISINSGLLVPTWLLSRLSAGDLVVSDRSGHLVVDQAPTEPVLT